MLHHCLSYKTSDLQHVNDARKEIFCQKGKAMGRLPPTQNTLLQYSIAIRLEYGTQVRGLLGAGHLMRTVNHGFQYGTQYICGLKGLQ